MDEYRINGLTIKENLLQLAENENKKFTESLHPGIENVLGIRIPALRRLGAQIAKDDWESYLQTADTYYMEERMLQGMVISNLKMKDTQAYLSLVARFVAIINSWAVCDTFDFYGKQRFVDKNKKRVWLFLEDRMKSDKEYEIRFGVVMAMAHYIDEEYIDNVLQWMDRISHEGYYVKMAVAWALSVCYVKFPQKTMNYLKENHLDDFTYNKDGGQRNHPQHEKKKQIMSIYRKEALNPSERNSPFIFGKIQTAPAAINNREKLFLPNQIS